MLKKKKKKVQVLVDPNLDALRGPLTELHNKGIQSVAVVLMHSYAFGEHEQKVKFDFFKF